MSASELTERERLAAEHALRLLDGEELVQARGLMVSDPAFAAEVAAWEDRLSDLHAAGPAVTPGADLWPRIEAAIAADTQPTAEIAVLQTRVRRLQWFSTAAAAAAVAAVSLYVINPGAISPAGDVTLPPTVQGQPQAPLMANIPIGDTQLRLAVTYLPDDSELLVSASGLTADGVHDHELWLVLPDGAQSLGVVVPGEQRRVAVSAGLAAQIAAGSDLVLTREPLGGAPKGGSAGPVVAQGEFSTV